MRVRLSGGSSLSAATSENQKRALLEEIGQLSKRADEEIIERAIALAGLVKIGAATCNDIDSYNATALAIWRVNISVFRQAIVAGADREKLSFPFQPPLFTQELRSTPECIRSGQCSSLSIDPPCVGGVISPRMRIFTHGSPEQVDLFRPLQPSGQESLNGLGGLGALPLVVTVALWASVVLIGAGAATWLTVQVIDRLNGTKLQEARNEYNKLIPAIGAAKTSATLACIRDGQSASDCRRVVDKAFPAPSKPSEPGVFSGVLGTAVKYGGVFLLGNWIYNRINPR